MTRHCILLLLSLNLVGLPALAAPILSITTENQAPIVSREAYLNAELNLDGLSTPLKIRGRGNSTWEAPKKPYKIKLNEASSIFLMPPHKNWNLLANYSDKTLMRNHVALEFARRLRFSRTPRNEFVELRLNGGELGTYLLTESIEVSPGRLNLKRGGYLIELDQRRDGDLVFQTNRSTPYVVKWPSHPQNLPRIQHDLQHIEDILYSQNFADPLSGYVAHLDKESFIDFFLLNELFKNQDAASFSSIYLSKNPGDKLKMEPVWDFDLAAGNVNYSAAQYPEGWWLRTRSPWFSRLFQDPSFAKATRLRWEVIKDEHLPKLFLHIDETAKQLDEAQQRNFKIWDILDKYVWPNPIVTGSYAGEVEYLKNWLTQRAKWLDENL